MAFELWAVKEADSIGSGRWPAIAPDGAPVLDLDEREAPALEAEWGSAFVDRKGRLIARGTAVLRRRLAATVTDQRLILVDGATEVRQRAALSFPTPPASVALAARPLVAGATRLRVGQIRWAWVDELVIDRSRGVTLGFGIATDPVDSGFGTTHIRASLGASGEAMVRQIASIVIACKPGLDPDAQQRAAAAVRRGERRIALGASTVPPRF